MRKELEEIVQIANTRSLCNYSSFPSPAMLKPKSIRLQVACKVSPPLLDQFRDGASRKILELTYWTRESDLSTRESSQLVEGAPQSGCKRSRSNRKFVPLRWEIPRIKMGAVDEGMVDMTYVQIVEQTVKRKALRN